jgi:hypothetical protein
VKIQLDPNASITVFLAILTFIIVATLLFKPESITISKIFTIVFKSRQRPPPTNTPSVPIEPPMQTLSMRFRSSQIESLRFLLFYTATYNLDDQETFLNDLKTAYSWALDLRLGQEILIALEAVIYIIILYSNITPWTLESAQVFSRLVLHICTLIN